MSTNVETKVEETDVNLDELLGTPGSDSVMTPQETVEEKPTVTSGDDTDKFLDTLTEEEDKKVDEEEIDTMLKIDKPRDEQPAPEVKATNMNGVVKKLIEQGVLFGFEGEEKSIDDYTDEDYEELIKANIQYQTEQNVQNNQREMFESLPPEMQAAMDYISNGGKDIKGMLRALSETVEVHDLNVDNEDDQKQIIRNFYTMTNWGSVEDIEDEIRSLQDKGELKKKATQFKPKLDAHQQELINAKLENQKKASEMRQKQAENYVTSLRDTLSKNDLNGIPINDDIRMRIYDGLVKPNYPSVSGSKTNMLGYLLEKYQWVEPRHDLIAEVLWHLADPDGFKKTIKSQAEQKQLQTTMRQLKTEQEASRRPATNTQPASTPKLTRPNKGFLSR